MALALLVRFRPAGPWRLGPGNGSRTHTSRVLHSDSLFSAVTTAMRDLGWLEEWIASTAESERPAVRLSSCYPYAGSTLLIQPPRSVWPPHSGRLRWKSARFVPLSLIPSLLREEYPRDDHWAIEPFSECLLPVVRNVPVTAPFRIVQRITAPVDRVNGVSERVETTACLQFASDAGMWFVAAFDDDAARETWLRRLEAAARLLADTGIGGGRSQGWGRSHAPEFETVDFPGFFTGLAGSESESAAWWLLSLYSPAERDAVDWGRGDYGFEIRSGRTESLERWGDLKPASRMVAEGSVLVSATPPSGTARNVSDLSHAVYRSGIALAVAIPWAEGRPALVAGVVEEPEVQERAEPSTEEAPVVPSEPPNEAESEVEIAEVPEMQPELLDEAQSVAEPEQPAVESEAETVSAEAPERQPEPPAEVEPVAEPERPVVASETVTESEPVTTEAPEKEPEPLGEAEPVAEPERPAAESEPSASAPEPPSDEPVHDGPDQTPEPGKEPEPPVEEPPQPTVPRREPEPEPDEPGPDNPYKEPGS